MPKDLSIRYYQIIKKNYKKGRQDIFLRSLPKKSF